MREGPIHVPGTRLGRYELLFTVASGGMGTVWAGRLSGAEGFRKLFAIKTILPELANDPKLRKMFVSEARVAALIEHPNVAQTFELGEEGETLFQVLEWVDGDSFQELIRTAERRGERVPHAIVLRIIADACLGLHAAHELTDEQGQSLGFVHRDVSPHNILVTTKGTTKLIDFGVAKLRAQWGSDTTSGTLKGKLRYMAPEQALGSDIDRRVDVWGMAASLYVALTGNGPFPGDDMDVMRALVSFDSFTPLPPSIPQPIADVVHRALRHDRLQRYATALEFGRAVETAMQAASLNATTDDVATYSAQVLAARAARRRHLLAEATEQLLRPSSANTTPAGSAHAARSPIPARGSYGSPNRSPNDADGPSPPLAAMSSTRSGSADPAISALSATQLDDGTQTRHLLRQHDHLHDAHVLTPAPSSGDQPSEPSIHTLSNASVVRPRPATNVPSPLAALRLLLSRPVSPGLFLAVIALTAAMVGGSTFIFTSRSLAGSFSGTRNAFSDLPPAMATDEQLVRNVNSSDVASPTPDPASEGTAAAFGSAASSPAQGSPTAPSTIGSGRSVLHPATQATATPDSERNPPGRSGGRESSPSSNDPPHATGSGSALGASNATAIPASDADRKRSATPSRASRTSPTSPTSKPRPSAAPPESTPAAKPKSNDIDVLLDSHK